MAESVMPATRVLDGRERVGLRSPEIPAHLGVILGLATAGYSIALAGVSALQGAAETALAADRSPVAAAIDEAAANHDRLESALGAAGRDYATLASGYGTVTERLMDVEARIGTLAGVTGAIDGAARALPTRIAMPPVVRSVGTAPRATAHATSGGSAAP
jgi:hypothetical protein